MANLISDILRDLPPELRMRVFSDIAGVDKIIVPPKQIINFHGRGPLRFVSHFMLAFQEQYYDEYVSALEQHLIKHKQVIKVIVIDYDFTNFKMLLNHLEPLDEVNKSMTRLHFTRGGTNPLDEADLNGPYFSVNLIFTSAFSLSDADKIPPYLSRLTQVKRAGQPPKFRPRSRKRQQHLRIFYRVIEFSGSPEYTQYVQSLSFDPFAQQGQMKFLMAALQKVLAPALDTTLPYHQEADASQQRADINAGLVQDDDEITWWRQVAEEQARRANDAFLQAMGPHYAPHLHPPAYAPPAAGHAAIAAGMVQAVQPVGHGPVFAGAPLPLPHQHAHGPLAATGANEDSEMDDEENEIVEEDEGHSLDGYGGYAAIPPGTYQHQHGYAPQATAGATRDAEMDDDEEDDDGAQAGGHYGSFAAFAAMPSQHHQAYGPPAPAMAGGAVGMAQPHQSAGYGAFQPIPSVTYQQGPADAPAAARGASHNAEIADRQDVAVKAEDGTAIKREPSEHEALLENIRSGETQWFPWMAIKADDLRRAGLQNIVDDYNIRYGVRRPTPEIIPDLRELDEMEDDDDESTEGSEEDSGEGSEAESGA